MYYANHPGVQKHFKNKTYLIKKCQLNVSLNQNKIIYKKNWDGLLILKNTAL